ncbi:MAG: flagellar hook-associated protein FlgK [Gemmatimonadales bacterium]|nr:MAG: flagellar hook-associated protein FlgK [Gemmatimonadales bacterium]
MSSIGRIISTASNALQANQAALSVTGQNVANASTEGYSRQRALMVESPVTRLAQGSFGGGVMVQGVERMRDILLDAAFRTESSKSEGFRSHADLMRRVEGAMGEPGDAGISAALDRFYSAWSELATAPESEAARSGLRQVTEALTFRMNEVSSGIERLRLDGFERLEQGVGRVQALVADVVAINRSIVTAEASGVQAPDLRDSRDRALDELARLLPIQVQQNADGTVRVNLGGIGIVDGQKIPEFGLDATGGQFRLMVGSRSIALSSSEGQLGGIMQAVNHDIPALRAGLDAMANALVESVNSLHRTGTNPLGQEGVDFFHVPLDGAGDPLPVSAAGIRLSDAVLASALAIAAGPGSGEVDNEFQPGVNSLALSLAGLRDQPLAALGGQSVSSRFGQIVGEAANATRRSRDGTEVHRILAQQADHRRAEVSGVSLDEEMVKLIQFQAAYSAAARVLSAADEMLQTLLQI